MYGGPSFNSHPSASYHSLNHHPQARSTEPPHLMRFAMLISCLLLCLPQEAPRPLQLLFASELGWEADREEVERTVAHITAWLRDLRDVSSTLISSEAPAMVPKTLVSPPLVPLLPFHVRERPYTTLLLLHPG